jgi:hypothetical protein
MNSNCERDVNTGFKVCFSNSNLFHYNQALLGRIKTSEPVYSAQRWEEETEKRVAVLENMKNRDVAGLSESLRESNIGAAGASPRFGGGGGAGAGSRGGDTGGGRVRPASARTAQSARDHAWGVRDSDVWGPPPSKQRDEDNGDGSGAAGLMSSYARPASARQPQSPGIGGGAGVYGAGVYGAGGGGGGGGRPLSGHHHSRGSASTKPAWGARAVHPRGGGGAEARA